MTTDKQREAFEKWWVEYITRVGRGESLGPFDVWLASAARYEPLVEAARKLRDTEVIPPCYCDDERDECDSCRFFIALAALGDGK